jgi:GH43 family beta-xylosidase
MGFILWAMKKISALVCFALASMALVWGIDNPLIEKRADPYVYLHSDGYYYFCATVPEYDRIELRRSPDLEGLREAAPRVVWRKHRFLFVEDTNLWAPELHFIDGKWYIYYAAGNSLAPYDVRIRVLENDSADPMAGVWKSRGRLRTGWNTLSLDATSFELRGRRYLLWAQRLSASASSSMDLYIARMRDPLHLAGRAVMIGRADRPWELRDPLNPKMQGPAVLKRNGRVFISYSSNATDARYCVGLLEASDEADPLDPASWRKLLGPALQSDPDARVFGPGHNSFTTSKDGITDYIVYHARNYERVVGPPILDPNRDTRIQAFTWDSEGRPYFGKPVPDMR